MFSKILICIKKIFFNIKNALSILNQIFFGSTKKILISSSIFILFFSASVFSYSSAIVSSKNIGPSLSHNADIYHTKNKDTLDCIAYYEQINKSEEAITYISPDLVNDLRSNFYDRQTFKSRFFTCYIANWKNKYSPAVVSYNGIEKNISFLCWPKKQHLSDQFLYPMPFVDESNSAIQSNALLNDIYISDIYANELIRTGKFLSYKDIINSTITLDMKISHERPHKDGYSYKVANDYVVRGIINSSSDEYKEYENKFGEFFLVNDFSLLQLPSVLYFEISDSYVFNKTIFNYVLEKMNYNKKILFDKSPMSDYFQCRIGYLNDNDIPISSIFEMKDEYNERSNKIFTLALKTDKIVDVINFCSSIFYILTFLLLFFVLFNGMSFNYISLSKTVLIYLSFVLLTLSFAFSYLSAFIAYGISRIYASFMYNVFVDYLLISFIGSLLIGFVPNLLLIIKRQPK